MMVPVSILLVWVGVVCAALGYWKFNSNADKLAKLTSLNQPKSALGRDPLTLMKKYAITLLLSGFVLGMGGGMIIQSLAP